MKKTVKNLITWSPSHLITSQKSAFTLAEVLITLAIIGVVAAMTIPTLTANYKKKLVETRLAKFYSNMQQAVKLSEIDNGPVSSWDRLELGYVTDAEGNPDYDKPYPEIWFNKYLAPYIKVQKVENIAPSVAGIIAVYFLDGSMMGISSHSINFCPVAQNCKTFYDDEGIASLSSSGKSGIDLFNFYFHPWDDEPVNAKYHINKGIEPYARLWSGVREELISGSSYGSRTYGCKPDVGGAYCAKLIQLNNWKIPEDYPLKF